MKLQKNKTFVTKGICGLMIVAIFMVIFGWIVNESWTTEELKSETVTRQALLQPMTAASVIEQKFIFTGDQLTDLIVYPEITGRWEGTLYAEVLDGDSIVANGQVLLSELTSIQEVTIAFAQNLAPSNRELTLRIGVMDVPEDSFLSLYWGDTIQSGRYQFPASDVDGFTVNGEAVKGHLDVTINGKHFKPEVMTIYAYVCIALLALYIVVLSHLYQCRKKEKKNLLLDTFNTLHRYNYLIQRFVSRDFNTKYRQSVLGVVWSFLNPLLTMCVQYIVFSTLFKSSIEYFVVYLLSGIIMFNYFGEACGMGMESITANGYLINKVSVPKFIYPFSRILSSLINLMISLVPLLAVMLLSGLPITKAILLLPIPILFMVIFAYGMSLLLCTSNVFFRDTRFLWSVVVMLWNFLTPIFYPESIIAANLLPFFHMNPMYQYIYFVRCILISGVTPQPINYLYCALCSFIPLLLGLWVFNKKQNSFILYI